LRPITKQRQDNVNPVAHAYLQSNAHARNAEKKMKTTHGKYLYINGVQVSQSWCSADIVSIDSVLKMIYGGRVFFPVLFHFPLF
jgi:hypothetical protein